MLEVNQILEIVRNVLSTPPQLDEKATPKAIVVSSSDLLAVCRELHQNPKTYFDMLSCITGIDNGPTSGTMEVVYNLYSIPFNHHVMIKVILPREDAEVDSVVSVWRGAEWLERETYDLFGIKFTHHPDLRRILLPADWQGYPLRKDYAQQTYYHHVKVEY